jgi:hypothetical protein
LAAIPGWTTNIYRPFSQIPCVNGNFACHKREAGNSRLPFSQIPWVDGKNLPKKSRMDGRFYLSLVDWKYLPVTCEICRYCCAIPKLTQTDLFVYQNYSEFPNKPTQIGSVLDANAALKTFKIAMTSTQTDSANRRWC